MGKLFLIQWDPATAEERAKALRSSGWQVEVESEDGARACKRIAADPPDVILADLAKRPSHSRETVRHLQQMKGTRNITVFFIDGREEDVAKARGGAPGAAFTTSACLLDALAGYDH